MPFDYDLFIEQYLYLLFGGIFLSIVSVPFFEFRKHKTPALVLLVLGALFIRLFISFMDPFLHGWDEQFHALVAKNLMNDPFKPLLLKDPLLPYSYKNWTENHIWLHKQPLFLWQIALSFKLFGPTEFALRLPSILMSTFVIVFIYKRGAIHNCFFVLCNSGYLVVV